MMKIQTELGSWLLGLVYFYCTGSQSQAACSKLVEKDRVNLDWSRKWQPTPVFLPENSHGQKSLVGYTPWGRKEWNTTKQLSTGMRRLSLYHSLDWKASPWFPQDFFPRFSGGLRVDCHFCHYFQQRHQETFSTKVFSIFVGYTISVATTHFCPCNAELLLDKCK